MNDTIVVRRKESTGSGALDEILGGGIPARSVIVLAGPPAPGVEPRGETTVLVVDDDPDVCWALEELLRPHGYTVLTAANGREALDRLHTGPRPQLILLDIAMPVMDGETFQAVCAADPALASIPLVVISANAAHALRLQRRGALACMAKPFSNDALLDAIAGWIH